jgi:acetyl esterase/lipase
MTSQPPADALPPAGDVPPGASPPLDSELAGPLRAILAGRPSLTPDLIPARRAQGRAARLTDAQIRRDGAFEASERLVPGPPGGPPLSLLICQPAAARRPCPVIYNAHGGGMVTGDNRTTELLGELDRAQAIGAVLVAPDYRLAPEHPDPAPVQDCYAGLAWVAGHAASLGADPGLVFVSGNSAGGGLAAGLALLARDRGGPPLAGQLLQFPMLDDRCDSPSARAMEQVGMWDGRSNRTGWSALLGARRGTASVSCYAAPARAASVAGLPPAFIEVGAVEALRDEGVRYASRIWQAGGDAELHVWAGAFHSFDEWVPDAVVSGAARQARSAWLRRRVSSVRAGRQRP